MYIVHALRSLHSEQFFFGGGLNLMVIIVGFYGHYCRILLKKHITTNKSLYSSGSSVKKEKRSLDQIL